MDGRAQLPIIKWMQEKYSVPFIDMITEPGPTKVFLHGTDDEIEKIKDKVIISRDAHGSKSIAVIGHHDCAGNPVSRDVKCRMIEESVEKVKAWGFDMEVIGLYVNENWEVEQVI